MTKPKENNKTKAVVKRYAKDLEKQMEKDISVKMARVPDEVKPLTIIEKMVSMVETMGTIEFTKKQQEILFAPIDEKDIEIRADGQVYLPWVFYKERLRDAFWGKCVMLPATPQPAFEGKLMLWGFFLVINGKFQGFAIGQQEYHANNPTMNYGDAIEGAKSNAGMRLCKDIGIGLELWKPSFIRGWKKKHAESYTYDKRGTTVKGWRLKGVEKPKAKARKADEGPEYQPPTGTVAEEVYEKNQEDRVDDLLTGQGDLEKIAIELAEQITKDLEKLHKVDVKAFKQWLWEYQTVCEPPKDYIGKFHGNLSLRVGDIDDLKTLHSQLAQAVEKYKKSLEQEEPEEPEDEQGEIFS